LGIEGSPLELLLWNLAILQQDSQTPRLPPGIGKNAKQIVDNMKLGSVREKVLYKRRLLGIGNG